MAWQLIETAPKDGSYILITGGQPDHYYDGDTVPPMAVGWWDGSYSNGFWRFCYYDSGIYGEWESPTKWQPLPRESHEAGND